MPKKILYLLVFICGFSFSQTVSVDDTSYSDVDLANLLLQSSCITANNVSYSSGQSVAYFENNGGAFPIAEGIILRSGIASHTAGMYTNTNLSSNVNTVNDPDLNAIADAVSGQDANVTDSAFLEFEFTPISSDFNFNFIFASNEYGEFQCDFSDVFAFLLTDVGAGTTNNLAVIQGTTTPIAVTTVRDNANNGGCTSENPGLFDVYNVTNPPASTINMRGFTTTLNAAATLVPGNTYRIKLAIADFTNTQFDSAVFIDTGSFNSEIDLGDDTTLCSGNSMTLTTNLDETEYDHSWTFNGNPTGTNSNSLTITQPGTYAVIANQIGSACQIPGEIVISDLSYDTPSDLSVCDTGAANYSFDLTTNNINTLNIDSNTYSISYFTDPVDINNPIPANDLTNYQSAGNETIIIKVQNINTNEFCDLEIPFDLLLTASVTATQPDNIDLCETGAETTVDLTQQNAAILNGLLPSDYNITFYSQQADAEIPQNPIGSSINVSSANSPVTVFVRLESVSNSACFATTSFQVIVHPLPVVDQLNDVTECSQYTLPNLSSGTYYDAPGGPTGGGTQYNPGDILDSGGVYYVFVGPDANGCTNESSFTLILIDEYNLQLHYCQVDMFTIPPPLNDDVDSNFYTEPGGPNGTGTLLPSGTSVILNQNGDLEYQGLGITVTGNSDTIHYYAEVNGVFCIERAFPISIFQDPLVDQPSDVITCLSYTLPPLTNGEYDDYNVGDVINTSQTIGITNEVIYNTTDIDGNPTTHTCDTPSSFEVTIINNPTDIDSCDSYILPDLEAGDYYFEANGQGTIIPQGSTISLNTDGDLYFESLDITVPGNNDEIFVFAPDTENIPNCTNNFSFTLTIYPTPDVDTSNNIVMCTSTGYILPNLTNGNYYSQPNGQGVLIPQGTLVDLDLDEFGNGTGDLIFNNGLGILNAGAGNINIVYIYNEVNNCPAESSFEIEIRDLPIVDSLTNYNGCDPFELQPLTNGIYLDANGDEVAAGTIISEPTTFTIYNEWNDLAGCSNQTIFTVNSYGVEVGTYNDVNECDNFTLLANSEDGFYYLQSHMSTDAQGNPVGAAPTDANNDGIPDDAIPAGTQIVLNSNGDLEFQGTGQIVTGNTTTIYVYAYYLERDPACFAETSFNLTLNPTPVLPAFPNLSECEGYELPALDNSNYNVGYYLSPDGVDPVTDLELDPGDHIIYVYATAFNNSDCSDQESFTISIFPKDEIFVDGGIICVDPSNNQGLTSILLDSGVSATNYTVNWILNGNIVHTGATYNTNEAGTYTVEYIPNFTANPPNCGYIDTTVTVEASSSVVLNENTPYTVSEYFVDQNSITVNVVGGLGEYMYQLDGGTPQESNVFNNIISGDHTITIIDVKGGCDPVTIIATVINYPKFFSPNGDGLNDFWNITDLRSVYPESEIIIFNRFGKFITNFTVASQGWDGTYNGEKLFSDDYWFVVKYKNQDGIDKEFRAHFSLKR